MLRKMGILLAGLALGAAVSAEELREIEYEKIYDSLIDKRVSGRYIKSSLVIQVRNSDLDLSTLKVFIETENKTPIEVDIDTNIGATNFPMDESLIGSTVLTNAPEGSLGIGVTYEINSEGGDSLLRTDIVGTAKEYQEFIDGLGFFARLFAPDLTGFSIPLEENETMTATIGLKVIESENSRLFLPIDLVMQSDFSEIKFSSVPSGFYLSVE
ncbi:MAG TPA: hypothetical protein VFM61_06275 [Pseudidiomarina sp.]|nr:hypothetical protein [Pseudidiomarina sp.]